MKKLISIFLVLAMMLTLAPMNIMAANTETTVFLDMKASDYYAKAATALEKAGILSGYPDGTFGADKSITRAEMAAVVVRMIDKEADAEKATGKTNFDDVADNHWASGYINIASEDGIINGDGNGKFRPEDDVKHEEAIKMVVCALGFADDVKINPDDWSKAYLDIANDKKITKDLKGSKGKAATRGDIAVMSYAGKTADLAMPITSLEEGSYIGTKSVTLKTETKDAEIYYTTDGTTPTVESTKYTKPISVSKTCTLKAITVLDDVYVSDVLAAEYTIKRLLGGGGSSASKYSLKFNEPVNGKILNGSDRKYKENQTVEIEAVANEGYTFVKWESSNGGVFEDDTSSKTIFTMPKNEVTLSAVFTDNIQNTYVSKRFSNSIILVANATYNNNTINILWSTTLSGDSYNLYSSTDGVTYNIVAENVNTTSYDFDVSGITNDLFFKVVQLNESGNIESNIVKMVYSEDGFTEFFDDSDSDGLSDYLEDIYGTNANVEDTDKDGLSDYHEIYITFTEPLVIDTDFNGINDGEEDFDNDGINNITEIVNNTNPFDEDTDNDNLSDYDEIYTNKTNPTIIDTDNDGLSDSIEITLNTDPLNSDTNGNGVLDGDENYLMSANIEEFDHATKPTLEISATGSSLNTLVVQKTNPDNIMTSSKIPGYIGCGYDFNMSGSFDDATLTIEFDKSLLENEGFNPVIYYIDEENQQMIEMPTTVVGNSATTRLEHFSTYILLNKTEFDKVWEKEIKPPMDNEEQNGKDHLDVVLVIDSSGSMSSNDSQGLRKTVAKDFVNKLGEKDRAAVIDFDSYANLYSSFTSDKAALETAIDKIDSNGGTNLGRGISLAIDQFTADDYNSDRSYKYIVMLTDGQGSYNDSLTTTAATNEITIYTIGLGSGVDENVLKTIAEGTGGKYYFASMAENLEEIFADVKEETIDYSTDSDNDGLPDYYEERLTSFNGVSFNLDKNNPDCDGDGLLDGKELVITVSDDKVYGKLISSPSDIDTDKDEIEDCYDTAPLKAWKPKTTLAKIVYDAGFKYYDAEDIIYSRKNARQHNLGYCYGYDEAIFAISSVLDCEPIYFLYDGKEWMIELWKGQYGIETGGEVGIYNRTSSNSTLAKQVDPNVSEMLADSIIEQLKVIFGFVPGVIENYIREQLKHIKTLEGIKSALDGINNWINHSIVWDITDFVGIDTNEFRRCASNIVVAASSSLTSKLYDCVDSDKYLKMSSTLQYNGGSFERQSLGHWWLTGFKWGVFTKDPGNILMNISITFENEQMKEAFLYGQSSSDHYDYSKFKNSIKNYSDNNNDNDGNYGLLNIANGRNSRIIDSNGKTVNIEFKIPRSMQPVSRAALGNGIQIDNEVTVNTYNAFKDLFNITSNDPNEIEESINYVIDRNVDLIDASFYNLFYSYWGAEFEKHFDEWYENKKFGNTFKPEFQSYVAQFLREKKDGLMITIDAIVNGAFTVAEKFVG